VVGGIGAQEISASDCRRRRALEELARDTEGFSAADLKALCQEAALAAMARESADAVTHADFQEAVRRHRSGNAASSALV
jgi:ATP-dependent 26S proteasome regulatory subunit